MAQTKNHCEPLLAVLLRPSTLTFVVNRFLQSSNWDHLKMYVCIYIYKVEKKIQTDYTFISTSLFRGCPLVRRFNKNILYHRLYTI